MDPAGQAPVPLPEPEDTIYLEIMRRQQENVATCCYSVCVVNIVLNFSMLFSLYPDCPRLALYAEMVAWLPSTFAFVFLCGGYSILVIFCAGVASAFSLGLMVAYVCNYWVREHVQWGFVFYLGAGICRTLLVGYLVSRMLRHLDLAHEVRDLEFRISQLKTRERSIKAEDRIAIIPKKIENIEEVELKYTYSDSASRKRLLSD